MKVLWAALVVCMIGALQSFANTNPNGPSMGKGDPKKDPFAERIILSQGGSTVISKLLSREKIGSKNPHCNELTTKGLFATVWSGRNCAGGVYKRGNTISLVTSADENSEPDRLAERWFPGSRPLHRFIHKDDKFVAIYYDNNKLHIGTGSNATLADNAAKADCRRNCRKLLNGFNTWKEWSIFRPDHETIQFINLNGKDYTKCGGRPYVRCRER